MKSDVAEQKKIFLTFYQQFFVYFLRRIKCVTEPKPRGSKSRYAQRYGFVRRSPFKDVRGKFGLESCVLLQKC